jgi:hypothetical protein
VTKYHFESFTLLQRDGENEQTALKERAVVWEFRKIVKGS